MRCKCQRNQSYILIDERRCDMRCNRQYSLLNFLFDILMIVITGGLWLIWIFVREMRNR